MAIINDAHSTNVLFKPDYDSEDLNQVFKQSRFSKTYLNSEVQGGGNARMTLDQYDYFNKQENKFKLMEDTKNLKLHMLMYKTSE